MGHKNSKSRSGSSTPNGNGSSEDNGTKDKGKKKSGLFKKSKSKSSVNEESQAQSQPSAGPAASGLPAIAVPVATERIPDPSNPFQEPLDQIREEERPLLQLVDETHFDLSTLRRLYNIFQEISSSQISDGFIDANELTTAMGLNPTCLLARGIFRIFDVKKTKAIDFPTWAKTLSALSSKANLEEKIKFSFSLFDLNSDGSIDVTELRQLLEAAVRENGLNLSDAEVKELCEFSLQHVDRDGNGTVEYTEYKEMVKNSIKFLESFTLDIDQLCESFFTKSRRGAAKSVIDEEEAKKKAEAFKKLREKKKMQYSHSEDPDPTDRRGDAIADKAAAAQIPKPNPPAQSDSPSS